MRLVAVAVLFFVVASAAPVVLFRFVDPPGSAFILRARVDSLLHDKPAVRRQWVSFEQMNPSMAVAVLASEDQRFPEHWGFDVHAIADAVGDGLEGKRVRGASTISQQVAKNLFLWEERSWLRKGLEVWFTVLLEAAWPKRRILEVYLNIAQFDDRVYGVEAAAHRFFGKPAARLTAYESSLLAAVLPSPRRYRAEAPSAYVRKRAAFIRKQMRLLGGAAYLARL